jgi:hypothetical protein
MIPTGLRNSRQTDFGHICAGAVTLLLHGEANRLDVDRIARLNGNVVVAGFHVRDFHDDLFLVLFYERGLVVGFFVGEEYGGNGAFSQILSRHGHGVIHFAGRRIYTRHLRRALRKEQRAQKRQQGRCGQKRQCRMDVFVAMAPVSFQRAKERKDPVAA